MSVATGGKVRFSYCMLPDYPLVDSIEMIKVADELGYYACYSVDETWHKDLWCLFSAAADKTPGWSELCARILPAEARCAIATRWNTGLSAIWSRCRARASARARSASRCWVARALRFRDDGRHSAIEPL